jgi:crotonobetainyl-CoA hydratase
VNEVVPAANLLARAHELAKMLADGPPLVFAAIKEVLRETEDVKFSEAIGNIMRRGFPTVAKLYASEDQLEGARAFAEKRDPVWKGK